MKCQPARYCRLLAISQRLVRWIALVEYDLPRGRFGEDSLSGEELRTPDGTSF